MRKGARAGLSRIERVAFVLCCLLSVAPMAVVTFPPSVDTAQHAAQIDMLLRYDDAPCRFDQHVEPNWFSPYLLGYLVALGFAQILSVPVAVKLTISLAIVAIPLSFAVFLRAARLPPGWVFLGFPLAYSFAVHWGFLSLTVGLPIGMLFLAAVLRYGERPSIARAVWMALFAVAIFFCHALLSMFCTGIALLLMLRQRPSLKSAVVWSVPLILVVPVAMVWLRATQATHKEASDILWKSEPGRFLEILPRLIGEPATVFATVFGGLLVLYPLLAGGRLSRRPKDWLPVYAALVWFLAAPVALFGAVKLYARLSVFTLPLFLLAIRPPETGVDDRGTDRAGMKWRWRFLAMALAIAWLLVMTVRWSRFEAESADFRRVLATMEPEKRAYSLVLDRWSEVERSQPVYLHFPLWYQVSGGCLTEPNFAWSYPIVLRYPPGGGPGLPVGIELAPVQFGLQNRLDRRWDYVLTRAIQDPRQGFLRGLPLVATAREGAWWLFTWGDPSVASSAR